MAPVVWLIIAGAVLDCCAYLLYNREFWQGKTRPPRAAWGVWTFLSSLNAASYLFASGDVVKTIVAFENAAMCALTFYFVMKRGTNKPLKRMEIFSIAIGLTAGLSWIVFRKATYANLILQTGSLVPYFSMLKGLWRHPKNEPTKPWFMWTIVYLVVVAVVLLRWQNQWYDLVYPVGFVITHLTVCLFTLRRAKSDA